MEKYKNNYVYIITNIYNYFPQKYIGTRSTNLEPLQDLGNIYFSSGSKSFIKEQKDHPERFEYYVIDNFKTREAAVSLEIYLHNLYDVKTNDDFYNKVNQTSTGFDNTGNREIAKKIGNANRGKKRTEKQKEYMSKKWLGENNPNFGGLSEEHKINISLSAKNRKYTPEGRLKRSKSATGSGNTNAQLINIYNEKGELMFECNGNFSKICEENNLPRCGLVNTYKKESFYTAYRTPRYNNYIGWYARKMNG